MKNLFFLAFLLVTLRSYGLEQINEMCDVSSECKAIKSIRLNTFPDSKIIQVKEVDSIFKKVVRKNNGKYEVIVPYKYPNWQYFNGKVNPFYSKYQPNEEAVVSVILKEYSMNENSKKIVAVSSYVQMRSSHRELLYWSDFGSPVVFYVENASDLSKKLESYFGCMYESAFKTPKQNSPLSCQSVFNRTL